MKNTKSKLTLGSKISIVVISLLIVVPIFLVFSNIDILKELKISFWILLSLNFIFVIVIMVSRLTNKILVQKTYKFIFNRLYAESTSLDTDSNLAFIDSIISYFKNERNNIDFKKDKIRLKEIIDSSYEMSAFPILTISFTILYTITIYNSTVDIKLINFQNDVIFMILNLVLIFTFIYISTITYFKIEKSLCKLCLNIIEEYNLE